VVTEDVGCSSLQKDSQAKLDDVVRGLAASW